MPIARSYKLLFLAGLKWDAEDQEASLFDVLKAAARARLTETQDGKVLVASASNGFSGTFSLPMNGQGMNPQAAAEMVAEMLQHYETAVDTLGSDPAPTDEAIYQEMVLLIRQSASREIRNDFSELRCG